jgi:hypothetical protein
VIGAGSAERDCWREGVDRVRVERCRGPSVVAVAPLAVDVLVVEREKPLAGS